jgi:surface polysaccharide O-acyltransferase-like enzyme
MSRYELSKVFSLALIALGLGLQFVEAYLLWRLTGKSAANLEMLAGTIPLSIGALALATRWQDSRLVAHLGRLGARYALGIYIIHPYFVTALRLLSERLRMQHSPVYGLVLVPLIFGGSLVSLLVLDRLAPRLLDLVTGDRQAFSRLRGGKGADDASLVARPREVSSEAVQVASEASASRSLASDLP